MKKTPLQPMESEPEFKRKVSQPAIPTNTMKVSVRLILLPLMELEPEFRRIAFLHATLTNTTRVNARRTLLLHMASTLELKRKPLNFRSLLTQSAHHQDAQRKRRRAIQKTISFQTSASIQILPPLKLMRQLLQTNLVTSGNQNGMRKKRNSSFLTSMQNSS